jgi:hypothetical protein
MRLLQLDGGDVRHLHLDAAGRVLHAVLSTAHDGYAIRTHDLALDAALAAGPNSGPLPGCNAAGTRWVGLFPDFSDSVGVRDSSGRVAIFAPPRDDFDHELTALALSANGKYVFAGLCYRDPGGYRPRQGVLFWNAAKAFAATAGDERFFSAVTSPKRLKVPGDAPVTAITTATDGSMVAVGTESGLIYLRGLPSREPLAEFEIAFGLPSTRAVRGLVLKNTALLAWTDRGATAWDTITHEPLWRYVPGHSVAGAALSADGQAAAVAGEETGLILLDSHGGLKRRNTLPIGDVLSVIFASDGLTVVAGGEAGSVAVVDTE